MSALAAIVDDVARRTGLAFSDHQRPRILRAIASAADTNGFPSLEAYAGALAADRELVQELVDSLVVGETYFFRDRRQVDMLRHHVLPALRTSTAGRIQVWSAGCASGEEAYTLSMLAHEVGIGGRTDVLGTDLSAASIERAEAAEYGPWSLRAVSERARPRWFDTAAGRYRVRPMFRRSVRFRQGNLLESPAAGFHLIVCRNVLMYMTPDAIARAGAIFRDALDADGWLVLGASDPPLQVPELARVRTPSGLVYRRLRADEAPAAGTPPHRPAQAAARERRRQRPIRPTRPPTAPTPALAAPRALGDDITAVAAAVRDAPLDAQLRYALASLHLHAGEVDDAAAAARAALYLDGGLGVAHLVLGHCERARGDAAAAARQYRLAARALAALPPETEVIPASGEPAGHLAALAAQLATSAGDDER